MELVFHVLGWSTIWIALSATLIVRLYRRVTKDFDVFSKQGIPGPKPLPLLGNTWGVWKENLPNRDVQFYRVYGKTYGAFDGIIPNLYTVDEDLIKSVMIKDFDHFVNRRNFDIHSKVFRMFLTALRDQAWKDVRSSVSPTFSTGKIKRMSVLIAECAKHLSTKLEKAVQETGGKFDVKLMFSSYTIDVIARCAFGMRIDKLGEKDDPFTRNAFVAFNPPINQSPLFVVPFILQGLFGFTGVDYFFASKEMKFFVNVLEDLIKSREGTNQKYHDFVEIATESLAASVKEDINGEESPMWTKDEATEIVISQSVLFLLAGFDTTATTLTNACYLLAKHPDVQDKLYQAIVESLELNNGEITHETVNNIPYLEQVILEVLRLYPPLFRTERECSKDVTYGNITIKKGMVVSVPIFALHRVEEYYPNPEQFDPERWTPENKAKRSPYIYAPFGLGPRNCVGMRFALEEIKFALCNVVSKFRFFPTEETPEKPEIQDGANFVLQLKKFFLCCELRS